MVLDEWKATTLGAELKNIQGGGTPSRKEPNYWNGTIPWATVKDLVAVELNDTEEYITKAGLNESASNLIPAGTVIVATRMALGKAVRFSQNVAINQDLKALYPKDSLSSDFLVHWLIANASTIQSQGNGSTVQGISLEALRSLSLLLPPLSEQKKIAAILRSVDEAIASTQAVIDQTRKVKQGLLQQLLTRGIGHTKFKHSAIGKIPETWEVLTMENAGNWHSGGTPSRNNKSYWNGTIPWVSPKDMKCERLSDTIEHLTELGVANGTRLVPKGTILIVVRGMILAHSFPVAVTLRELTFNQDIKALLPSNKFTPEFILYWLQYKKNLILDLTDEATHGTKRFPQQALLALQIPCPLPQEQEDIVKMISSVEKSVQSCKLKLEQLSKIKRGLMQDLLTGRVRVGGTP